MIYKDNWKHLRIQGLQLGIIEGKGEKVVISNPLSLNKSF